ncbi:hypothetical protein Btru_075574 [Bulinus truncatus]|nr:hypothetical protein Btru_075574 [Bulinus truncatus]
MWSNVAVTKSSSDSASASGNPKAGDCDIASIVPKANSKVENGKTDNEEKIDELLSKNNQHKTDQCNALKFEKNRPAERIAQEELNLTNSKLSGLLAIRQTGLWTDEMKNNANELEEKKKKLKHKLHRLSFDWKRKRSARADMKEALQLLVSRSAVRLKKLIEINA